MQRNRFRDQQPYPHQYRIKNNDSGIFLSQILIQCFYDLESAKHAQGIAQSRLINHFVPDLQAQELIMDIAHIDDHFIAD